MSELTATNIDLNVPISNTEALQKLISIYETRSKHIETLLRTVKDSHPEAVNIFLNSLKDDKSIIHSCHTILNEFLTVANEYCSHSKLSNEEGIHNTRVFLKKRHASTIDCGSYFFTDISGTMRKCRVSKKNTQHIYYFPLNQRGHVLFNDSGIVEKCMKPTDDVYVSSDEEGDVLDLSNIFDNED
tara:strand:- start:1244 stop:1801 length:558 start_codon:yes stop_codon:yes gene_type:complete